MSIHGGSSGAGGASSNNQGDSGAGKSSESRTESAESRISRKADDACRSEASGGLNELNERQGKHRQEEKSQRNEDIIQQMRNTGKAKIGVITNTFGCSIELKDKDRVIVPGRSKEDLDIVKQMKDATARGELIGAGGKFIAVEPQGMNETVVHGTELAGRPAKGAEHHPHKIASARPAENLKAGSDSGHKQNSHDRTKEEGDKLRDKVAAAGEKIGNLGDKQRFSQYQESFEKRCQSGQISEHERVETYKQIDRLLNSKESSVVKPYERVLLAGDIMRFSGAPTECEQGNHNTCNVTTTGERLFTRNPAKAAQIIADTALKGEFQLDKNSPVIKLDQESLHIGTEELVRAPEEPPRRAYGTQVLNLALTNDITQRRPHPEDYRQKALDGDGRSGEHVWVKQPYADAQGNPIWLDYAQSPNISPADVAALNKRLDGHSGTVIMNEMAQKAADLKDPNNKDVAHINSAEQLKSLLENARKNNDFPLIIAVDAYDPSLFKAGKNSPHRGKIGHVISITGYESGKAQISNPQKMSDTAKNQTIDYRDLYRATVPGHH